MSILNLDITSKSKVFNCLLPQGNSYFHKFGRRNYPISDLNLQKIDHHYIANNKFDKVFCNSFYGDSICHPKLSSLVKRLNKHNKELLVFTHGSEVSEDKLAELKENNATLYLHLYGAFNSANLVTQNLNWKYIETLIEYYKEKLIIEYHIFKQNLADIDSLIDLCLKNNVTLNFKKEDNGDVPFSIINEQGEWLYDLLKIDNQYNTLNTFLNNKDLEKVKNTFELEKSSLYKSTQGYGNLKFYLFNKSNNNILNLNHVSTLNEDIDFDEEDNLYINYLGYEFNNKTLYEVFNQCLCDDWSQDYNKYVNLIKSFGFEKSKTFLHDVETHPRKKYSYEGHNLTNLLTGLRYNFLEIIPYIDKIKHDLEQNNLSKLS